MFSHVIIGTDDLDQARRFYDAVLGTLGANPGFLNEDRRLFYMHGNALFGVTKPINGEAATHANGGTVGFGATSPEQVDAWHAAGIANGGTSCEDPPGYRDIGGGQRYLAYLRDPAGNKLCAMYVPAG